MSLLRMGAKTNLSPQEVLNKAISFFGEQGAGLELVQQQPNAVQFVGGGGHVQITVSQAENGKQTEIDLQTRDWEYDVKRFLRQL